RDELDASILIGAGTVTGVEQLGPLRDIGIEFIVSPHTDENLITESLNLGLEPIPGVLSPTDSPQGARRRRNDPQAVSGGADGSQLPQSHPGAVPRD
ncbi:MAG: hypothetical protein IIB04_03860, partial [Acidobacteria bacterium]|nr:hypothetical protein [Acidobacteriota bacterium]